jgi:hypothetical protein
VSKAVGNFKVAIGPVLLPPDDVLRLVEYSDGSGRLEYWDGSSWRAPKGRAFSITDLFKAAVPSPEWLAARGIPS